MYVSVSQSVVREPLVVCGGRQTVSEERALKKLSDTE
jgi:hypothetical protein